MADQDSSTADHGSQNVYRYLSVGALLLLAGGTVVFRLLEDWSWVDSFYFSAVAVTTVGFGDVTPTSDAAKLFTVAYVFAGIAIVTTYLNAKLRRREERRADRRGSSG